MRAGSSPSFAQALIVHLVRGAAGALALAAAARVFGEHRAASAVIAATLVAAALIAWRGCPACWLMGLIGVCSGGSCPAPRRTPLRIDRL